MNILGPLPSWSKPRPLTRVPRVSVVVPCYNYGHYLRECVASILTQPQVEVDVLIIDDASPDGSAQVALDLARGDSRVQVLCHAQNKGHIATYNEGLERATGDYVVLLSADDVLTPGALARAAALMDANPQVGLVYGHPVTLKSSPPPPARTRVTSWSVWKGTSWIETMCRSGVNNISSPEAVVRRSVQHQVGGYRADLPHSGDLEMWIRIASVSDVGRVNGADQAFYRVHPKSMYRTHYAREIADLEERYRAFSIAFNEGPGHRLARAQELLQMSRRALAIGALSYARRVVDLATDEAQAVDAYVKFALETYPKARELSQWRALARRRASGNFLRKTGLRYAITHRLYDLNFRVRWRIRRRVGI